MQHALSPLLIVTWLAIRTAALFGAKGTRLPAMGLVCVLVLLGAEAGALAADPSSWNEGPAKPAILAFVDDKAGKPVGSHRFIGRRPIAAFGNSDGDLQMLQWTTMDAPGRRLGLIVHHDDAEREYVYDRASHVGRLDKALDAAPTAGWTVVSVKNDWRQVFPTD